MGEKVTRIIALVHAADWLLVGVLQPRSHHVFPVLPFTADVVGATVVGAFAVLERRSWTAVMAAFLLLGIVGYINFTTPNRAWHRAYITSTYVWGYGALVSLAFGAESDRRRRAAQAGASGARS